MKIRLSIFLVFGLTIVAFSQRDSIIHEECLASFYAKKFDGRKSSNGEIFRNNKLTAAHKTLSFGTIVKVTNLKNDSIVQVIITDRLPKKSKRCIDLSRKAAKQLNFINQGLARVRLEILKDSIL